MTIVDDEENNGQSKASLLGTAAQQSSWCL
jgi:hypothetical protein